MPDSTATDGSKPAPSEAPVHHDKCVIEHDDDEEEEGDYFKNKKNKSFWEGWTWW